MLCCGCIAVARLPAFYILEYGLKSLVAFSYMTEQLLRFLVFAQPLHLYDPEKRSDNTDETTAEKRDI